MLDKDWLYDQYWNRSKSISQIAKNNNITYAKVRWWLEKFNIPRRTYKEAGIGQNIGIKNGMWKGDKASYKVLHIWVNKWKPKMGICIICNEYKRTEFANIDHKYNRNLNDFIELCDSCHDLYDRLKGYRKDNGNCYRY